MNSAEAKTVLQSELAKYRAKPYVDLVSLIGRPQTVEATAPSGTRYQVEIQALWDDPKRPNDILRVIGAVDDGGVRTYMPVTDSFLIARSGQLVGE